MVFVISFPFLSILLTFVNIGTGQVLYFSVFSNRKLNSSVNYFASSAMVKW